MTLYIGIYLFMSVSTALASITEYTRNEVIASLIFGLLWPFVLTARIIAKIID